MTKLQAVAFAAMLMFAKNVDAAQPNAVPSGLDSAVVREEPLALNKLRAGFLYHKLSKTPVRLDDFSAAFAEVSNARDEFERRDVLAKVRPDIEEAQRSIETAKTFLIVIGSSLGEYDFDRKGFPTGISNATFIPYDVGAFNQGPRYAVSLKNGAAYSLLPMDEDKARRFTQLMRKCCAFRQVTLEATVVPVSTEKADLDRSARMRGNIIAKILSMRVLYDGRLVAKLPSVGTEHLDDDASAE